MSAGTWRKVSAMTGIPLETLYFWSKQPWYFDVKQRILEQQDEEISTKFQKIVKKAQEEVMDRLEKGDFMMKKDGNLIRKPVSARDASVIASNAIDKRNVLVGKPTSRVENISTADRLLKLAEEFRKFAKAKQIEGEKINAEAG
jgi:hypothetical protein